MDVPLPQIITRLAIVATLAIIAFSSLAPGGGAQQVAFPTSNWIEAGSGGVLPAETTYDNPLGKLGVLNASGPVDMKDHPFFEPLGLNPRGCVTCHQPASAMSVSVDLLRERWRVTKGEDSVFAAVDGSNNPKLAQGLESSHTLLLNRGVFRIGLPWPPRGSSGKAIQPEFTIEVVRDPTGVNLDDTYGLTGVNPTVSVFRRPRPSGNLKYVLTPDSVNLMADARHANLQRQAFGAYKDHQEGRQGQLSREEFEKIIGYETQVYVAQAVDRSGASLVSRTGPGGIGPRALADAGLRVVLDGSRHPVFRLFDAWRKPEAISGDLTEEQRQFRASAARGSELFASREFAVSDVANFNPSSNGQSNRRSCSSCHSVEMTGQHPAPGWMDISTSNYREPTLATQQSEVPVFKCVCREDAVPHPYLGRVIYTSDPGRALITGKCADIGSIVVAPLRGLAARAPYFANGSAKTLRDVVEYFDRRFNIKLTEEEKRDLANFLSVL
jgi:mono/diheme cytochrome c family protein